MALSIVCGLKKTDTFFSCCQQAGHRRTSGTPWPTSRRFHSEEGNMAKSLVQILGVPVYRSTWLFYMAGGQSNEAPTNSKFKKWASDTVQKEWEALQSAPQVPGKVLKLF